jgi:hypothetical protein
MRSCVRSHFQHAALVLDAEGLARNTNRHADFELLVGLHLLQVDVQVFVGDRIALDLLEEGQRLVGLVSGAEFDEDRAASTDFRRRMNSGPSIESFSGVVCLP